MTTFDDWKWFSYQTRQTTVKKGLLHRHFSNDANDYMGKFVRYVFLSPIIYLLLSITRAERRQRKRKTEKWIKSFLFNESKICWLPLPPMLLLRLLFYKMLLITIFRLTYSYAHMSYIHHGRNNDNKIPFSLMLFKSLPRYVCVCKLIHIFGRND